MIERAIDTAIVIKNGSRKGEDIAVLLHGKKGFQIREQYNLGQIDFECCECQQPLIISYQKSVYLKHKPNSEYCILKDEEAGKELIEEINRVNLSRESPRHIELKQKLIKKLQTTEGVSDIQSEEFQFYKKERRKPDVFCNFNGKEIAFEIQISNISQRYIFYRYNFYKETGIYLFWILDNFLTTSQNHRDRDIKYLNESENIFEVCENADSKSIFTCHFKEPFIFDLQVRSTWKKTIVNLPDLYFDVNIYQAYFYDFQTNKKKLDNKCLELRLKRACEEDEQRKFEESRKRILRNLQNKQNNEKQNLSEIENKTRSAEWEKKSIEEKIKEKRSFQEDPKKEINKLSLHNKPYFSRLNEFLELTEEIKKMFDHISENQEKINKINKKKEDYKEKIEVINQLKTVNFMGVEYKLIDPKKYKQFIIENKKRFVFAYSSTISSGNIQFLREDKTNTFEKILSQPDRYSFLISLRQELQNHLKNINEGDENLTELKNDTEEVKGKLEILFLEWLKNEIKILETKKKAIEDELFRLNIQHIDTDSKIKQIEEEKDELLSDEYK